MAQLVGYTIFKIFLMFISKHFQLQNIVARFCSNMKNRNRVSEVVSSRSLALFQICWGRWSFPGPTKPFHSVRIFLTNERPWTLTVSRYERKRRSILLTVFIKSIFVGQRRAQISMQNKVTRLERKNRRTACTYMCRTTNCWLLCKISKYMLINAASVRVQNKITLIYSLLSLSLSTKSTRKKTRF